MITPFPRAASSGSRAREKFAFTAPTELPTRRRFPDGTSRDTSAGSGSRAVSRQLRDGGSHARDPLVLQHQSGRQLGPHVDELLRLDRFGQLPQRRLGADAVQTDVDADAIEPGRQRRLTAKAAQAAIGAQEDILRQVARVLVVADETIAELVDRAAMTFDDQVEGAGPLGQAGLDQATLVQLIERRSSAASIAEVTGAAVLAVCQSRKCPAIDDPSVWFTWARPAIHTGKLQKPRELVRGRRAPREPSARQFSARGGVRIAQDVRYRRSASPGSRGEGAAKDVTCARAVDAVDLKRRRPIRVHAPGQPPPCRGPHVDAPASRPITRARGLIPWPVNAAGTFGGDMASMCCRRSAMPGRLFERR